ncbi:HSP20-like chaperone [Atractiella rhizophila]|nr:HSP20-like chaperone [Atractiella rhizophila]
MDVKELKDRFKVEIEIPGARKEDLKLEFEGEGGRTLTLTGKIGGNVKEPATENNSEGSGDATVQPSKDGDIVKAKEEEMSIWTSERFVGSFAKSFRFPSSIEVENVKATYKDGVLEVEVPKKEVRKEEGIKAIQIE